MRTQVRTVTLSLLVSAASACSGVEPGSAELEEGPPAYESSAAGQPSPSEVARIEFEDGGVVSFHVVDDVIAINETGHLGKDPHYVSSGQTPAEAFRSLAPDREIPEELKVEGLRFSAPPNVRAEQAEATAILVEKDHNGRFPFSDLQPSCNFNIGIGLPDLDERHMTYWIKNDRTSNGSSATKRAGRGWSLAAADLGEVRHEIVRSGFPLLQHIIQQGHFDLWDWTSPRTEVCEESCFLFSCTEICATLGPNSRADIVGVDAGENYHHCGFLDL
jgi:hypothetical protein